ncbi:MAG: hypothetical protein M3R63_20970 [Actinomycetota bacterium]|nr:hypothetical protein [Actinomycetota bacterium]
MRPPLGALSTPDYRARLLADDGDAPLGVLLTPVRTPASGRRGDGRGAPRASYAACLLTLGPVLP